ncbi:MAG: cupin domain-containing protein [Elusimicrobia bacterium]|nr:cupin domain-containing protein [Elusimicrobiota bacterium]
MMKAFKTGVLGLRPRIDGGMEMRLLPVQGRLRGISILHIRMPPQTQHPPVRHRRTDELAYVFSGRGRGVVGGRRMSLKAGDCIWIPAGTWHAFSSSADRMEVLSVFGPGIDMSRPDVELGKK